MFTKQYRISGMTCDGCRASVEKYLSSLPEVSSASVDLQAGTAMVESREELPLSALKQVLPEKYGIAPFNVFQAAPVTEQEEEVSKWKQLRPLFLIFAYLFTAAFLLNRDPFDANSFMLDFMGSFFIVFSFFKLLDLKGFPESFAMYDPLAAAVPAYGWIYPFLETALGLAFLMRYQTEVALWITLVILGITTVGVLRTLLSKKKIQCACLGTALKLPMTQATLIENCLMLVMAIMLLTKML